MTQANQPEMALTQEVRFAVVMYGGISLAIYMNGVAQELFKMVRATAPRGDDPSLASHPDDGLRSTEKVYRKLGRMLSWGEATAEVAEADSRPIRTRFVVDILSGSSAGGINAVYLAKALANDQKIDELKDLWIEQGDMGVLINDDKSVDDTKLARQSPPRSLLNGSRMYWKLLEALDGMGEDPPANTPSSPKNVEELDLYVTATDMAGQPVKLQLADKVVDEYRHRNVFHFRYREDGPNDFLHRNNPFLAFAARCTSAHPAAFEPMRLGDANDILDRYPSGGSDQRAGSIGWRTFFEEYLKPVASRKRIKSFLERDFNDGGVLDNRPFRHATDAMPLRRAGIPVSRKLVYLDPTLDSLRPEDVGLGTTDEGEESPGPDILPQGRKRGIRRTVIENAWQSLSTLPRYEPIREDLQRVLERNRLIERVNTIVEGMETSDFFESRTAKKEFRDSAVRQNWYEEQDWDRMTMSEMVEARGLAWAGYQHLRVTEVTDYLALLITRAAGFDEDSDEFRAVRELVRSWREMNYDPDGTGYRPDSSTKATEHAFLRRYDVSWRLRRLKFVLARIDRMLLEEQTSALVKQATGLEALDLAEIRQGLRSIRQYLSNAHKQLRKESQDLWTNNSLRDAVHNFGITKEDLVTLLKPQTRANLDASARAMSWPRRSSFEEFENRAQELIGGTLEAASGTYDNISAPQGVSPGLFVVARRAVHFYYENFASYDMISHPILYSTGVGEEMSRVDVFRISPRDAMSLINKETNGKTKLAGTKLNNFGAFFEKDFRTNDILWGRLDGAERIITALLPLQEDAEKREEMIEEAHLAILAEDVFEAEPPNGMIDAFRDQYKDDEAYAAKRRFDPQRLLTNAGRASRVFGDLLDGYSEDRRLPKRGVVWIARSARLFWLLVEVAVPGSLRSLMFRHGLKLLYVFEALMIVLGTLLLNPTVQQFGFVAFIVTAAVHATVLLLQDAMSKKEPEGERREGRWSRASRYVLLVLITVLLPFSVLGVVFVLAALGLTLPRSIVDLMTDPPGTESGAWRTVLRGALMLAVVAIPLLKIFKDTPKRTSIPGGNDASPPDEPAST